MQIYSKDLRTRAVDAVERGIPRREVVEIFSISLTTLKRWLKMSREGRDLSPGVSTGRRRRILSTPQEQRLLWDQLEENDDATLERHCELWEEKTGVRVSVSAMSRAIRGKLGWSYKKDAGGHRARLTEKKCFPRTSEGGRPEAPNLRGRVLNERGPNPALRKGAQGRKGARQGAQELGQERHPHLLDQLGGDGTIHEHRRIV